MTLGILPAAAFLAMLSVSAKPEDSAALVDVKVTHKYLVPICLNGASIKAGERHWQLELREHALAVTMRNDPHEAAEPHQKAPAPSAAPGVATVRFTPEPGHKYEVEVRASPSAFARRVWERGDWKPVVRDRTADRIVSNEPEWSDSGCKP